METLGEVDAGNISFLEKKGGKQYLVEDIPIGKQDTFCQRIKKHVWPFRKYQPEEIRPNAIEIYTSNFQPKSGSSFTLTDIEDVTARSQYGPLIVKGYLILLVLITIIPLILWFASTWGKPDVFSSGLKTVQDFTTAMLAGLSGINGLAGFVVGRYFRERENK